jgi:hypothetical protein
VTGCYGHGNETLGCILDQLSNYYLFRKVSAPDVRIMMMMMMMMR